MKVVFGLLGIVVLAVIAFLIFFDIDEVINAQKTRYLPRVEQALGRTVTVGEIDSTVLPVLGAKVKDITVMGRMPGDDPLLHVPEMEVKVDLWRALTSFGKDLRVNGLVVRGMEVNLVREPDGTLSYADVVKRLSEKPADAPPDEPMDPETAERIRNLRLDRVAIEEGRFRLVDKATGGAPAETRVQHLLVELEDVIPSQPFEVHVAAAVFADRPNFDLRTRLGPLPIGQPDAPPPPIAWLTLKADDVALAGLAPYLPPDLAVDLSRTAFGADLKVEDPLAREGHTRASGRIDVSSLAIAGGAPFALHATPSLVYDPRAGRLDLSGFTVAIDDMRLNAGGRVEGLNEVPTFHDLVVKSENLDLGRLVRAFPPLAKGLPPGSKLDGPFVIDLAASGDPNAQQVKGRITFDEATVLIAGALSKPRGTPLNAKLDAGLSKKDLDLRALRFQAGDLVLNLAGTVKNFDDPTVTLKGGTGRFDINGPARLLPEVRKALPPNVHVAGQAEIDLDVRGSKDNLDARAVVDLSGADLDVPGTTIKGSGRIELAARGNPKRDLTARLNAALANLNLRTDALVKPAGTPFDVRANVARTGDVVNLSDLLVHLGPLKVTGGGSANLATKALDVKAVVGRFAVTELAEMVPALKKSPIARAQLGTAVSFSGDPNRLSTINAELHDLFFGLGRSSLTGRMSVANLETPRIRFDLNAPVLDLDEMFPPGPEKEQKKAEPLPEIVRKMDLDGSIRVARGRAAEVPFQSFVASVRMQKGVLRFEKMDFDAYQGHFSAAGTTADLGPAKPTFDVRANVRNVSLMPLLTEQAKLPDTLSGRFSGRVALKGRGTAWPDVSRSLDGTVQATVNDGKFHKADLPSEILAPLSKRLPFLKLPKGPKALAFRDVQGAFRVEDGRAKLQQPLRLRTPQGPLTLTGWIGLDKTMKLDGRLDMAPGVIAAATGGKLRPPKAMPVGLTLSGPVNHPRITGIEVDTVAKYLAVEGAKQLGADKVLAATRKAEAEARKQAQAAKKKAEQKAKEAAEKAKRKAKEKAREAIEGLL